MKALQLMVIELEGLLDRTWIDKDHVDCPLFSVSQCIFCARQIAAAAEVPETVLCERQRVRPILKKAVLC